MWTKTRIRKFELGLRFVRDEFVGVVGPGEYRYFDPFGRTKIQVVSMRGPYLHRDDLDVITAGGALDGYAEVLTLSDRQRAIVWVDGRFDAMLGPGLYAIFTAVRKVRIEVIDLVTARFEHPELETIVANPSGVAWLQVEEVPADHVAVVTVNGTMTDRLNPGRHAFWRRMGTVRVRQFDRRETVLDLAGQEILTADKVTLRLNAQVTFRIADVNKAFGAGDDVRTVLYRDAQLALRAAVGVRELDTLLADKEPLAAEVTGALRARAETYGIDVVGAGIRDLILPGEMRELLNKVIEARKAAEASVITRREEAAALRHQANAAKLLADNPVLLRMRELEAVEKIATAGKLSVVLGEKGLADRIVNLV